jgi:hypothetical protein
MIGRAAKTVLRKSRRQVRPSREVCPLCFEDDHIGGRNHIPHITLALCQRHHAELTEERLVAGAEMKKQKQPTKSVEMALRSLAVTGRANARALAKICDALEFNAERLNIAARTSRDRRRR